MTKYLWIGILSGLLAACGSNEGDAPAQDATSGSAMTNESAQTGNGSSEAVVATASPPRSFLQCRTCHSVEKDGANGVGPNLWNVAGNPAAQKAGFNYSPAMKAAGLTWDDATLDAYLANPMKMIPGNKMAFAGLGNPEARAEVIAYMKTLKD